MQVFVSMSFFKFWKMSCEIKKYFVRIFAIKVEGITAPGKSNFIYFRSENLFSEIIVTQPRETHRYFYLFINLLPPVNEVAER